MPDNHKAFGPLVALDNEPPFAEPWQAQVMALAMASSQQGIFSAAQWSETFGMELRRNNDEGTTSDRTSYYQAALQTLEILILASGKLAQETITRREAEWRRAYLNTPHGAPVELSAGV